MSLEAGLFQSFDDMVRRQLDSVWHTVSQRTKQVGGLCNCVTVWMSQAARSERGPSLRWLEKWLEGWCELHVGWDC